MRIDNEEERKFYEIETITNNWSLRELQRQFDSAHYEQLALSRDKKGIKELSEKGQIIDKSEDSLKDPYFIDCLKNSDILKAILNKSLLTNLNIYF